MPTEKSQDFVPSAKRVLRPAAPRAAHRVGGRGARGGQRRCSARSARRSSAAPPTSIFAGVFGAPDPGRRHPGAGRGRAPRAGRGHRSPTCSPRWTTSCPARASTSRRSAGSCSSCSASTSWPRCCSGSRAGCSPCAVNRTIFRLRRDVEDKLNRLAAAVLRRAAARRAAQPGHQRHRQRRAEPAADAEPAAHLAAHRRRDDRDDGVDLTAARAPRPRDDPDHDGRHRR